MPGYQFVLFLIKDRSCSLHQARPRLRRSAIAFASCSGACFDRSPHRTTPQASRVCRSMTSLAPSSGPYQGTEMARPKRISVYETIATLQLTKSCACKVVASVSAPSPTPLPIFVLCHSRPLVLPGSCPLDPVVCLY